MSDEEIDDAALADEWAAALEQQDDDASAEVAATADEVVPAPLDDLMAQAEAAPSAMPLIDSDNPNLDVILDIPVSLSMEVGSTQINIRNLLQLNQGSVIELDRLAGEPLDVLVNGTLIAHGEVVVVNEKFGIRLTDVISPSERIKKLG
ncbi:MAG: flagellar motor switch protein FliN [Moraxellaceae bacterium]|nr:MAG: flagellar motor switch protein FliN [Moraxellaceae bacterium]